MKNGEQLFKEVLKKYNEYREGRTDCKYYATLEVSKEEYMLLSKYLEGKSHIWIPSKEGLRIGTLSMYFDPNNKVSHIEKQIQQGTKKEA